MDRKRQYRTGPNFVCALISGARPITSRTTICIVEMATGFVVMAEEASTETVSSIEEEVSNIEEGPRGLPRASNCSTPGDSIY